MKRLFLFLLLVPVGAAVIWSMGGCGARTEVAVGKVAEQIDDLLGRLDVKRTEIKRSLATLKQGQTGLLRARIRAQVKQDQLQRKMEPIERRMSDIDESLDVLREHLADGTPAELAGKTYPVAQVRVMADRLLDARRLSVRQVDGYRAAQQRLAAVVSTLERREAECGSRLSGIEQRLAVIDADQIALQAMQGASNILDDTAVSLANQLSGLEDKVDDLHADIQAELGVQDGLWNPRSSEIEVGSVEDIVKHTKGDDALIAEIDAIRQQISVSQSP